MPAKYSRLYQSNIRVAEKLGFTTVNELLGWEADPILFGHYWKEYEKGWVNKEKNKAGKRTKQGEFSHVVKRIAQGESAGKMVYSSDYPDTSSWTGIDWQARLLYKVVKVNRDHQNGIFYGQQLEELEMQSRAWLAILRRSWATAPSRETDQPPAPAPPEAKDGPDTVNKDRELIGRIFWTNISASLVKKGHSSMVTILDIQTLTFQECVDKVQANFGLSELSLRVELLVDGDGESITAENFAALLRSAEGDFVDLQVHTAPTYKSVLDSLGGQPRGESPGEISDFDVMLAEAKDEKVNMRDRFWRWFVLRNVGLEYTSKENFPLAETRLEGEDVPSAQECLMWYNEVSRAMEGEEQVEPTVTEISEEEIKRYRAQEIWLDNVDFQRQGHAAACAALGIADPQNPRFRCMPRSVTFQFWQVLAIKAMVDFEQDELLRGCILADEVGTGKTWEVLGLIIYVSRELHRTRIPGI